MNKTKKLLSIVLAVVIALSALSVMGSAAKATYQTVDNLEANAAYSPYGTVTRLSTEERASMVLDFLDNVLPPLNINMGTVIDALGITITINFTSVDNMLASIDSFKSSMSGFAWGLASAIVNLGVLEELNFDPWAAGMTRAGTAQCTILFEVLELLSGNEGVIGTVLSDGLELGIVANFIGGLDLSSINEMITDLPALIKGMLLPMFERWDHTTEDINTIENALDGDGKVINVLKMVVGDFLALPQSITTVKADASGNIISKHTDMPSSGTRQIYVKSGNTITVSHYFTQSDVDKDELDNITQVGYKVIGTYSLQKEYADVDDSDYVFVKVTDDKGEAVENGENLKYYEDDSYFLPSFVEAGKTIDITAESGAQILYKLVPYVYNELAPTVVNGSLKKLLGELFGATYKYVGEVDDGTFVTDDSAAAIIADNGLTFTDTFFTEEQGEYAWEWSNYKVIDGNHFYRFEDQVFWADQSNTNDYFNIIDWNYVLPTGLIDKYVPSVTQAGAVTKSAAGYSKLLHGFNDLVVELAGIILNEGAADKEGTKTLTYTLTSGDNSNLVGNIKALAQAIVGFHPEHIFGATEDASGNVSYGDFYNMFMSSDNDTVLTGIAAFVVDALAPQMIIEPSAIYDASTGMAKVKVGAIGAAMLRELATQLLPWYNYDALIYTNYNTGEFVSGKDNSYWLDVILTMGVDIGFKYLHNLADMAEDAQAWKNLGYGSESMTTPVTYTEAMLTTTDSSGTSMLAWEAKVDYIIDWALTIGETSWNMSNFVGTYLSGKTIDMATVQDPWAKLDAVLDGILFLDQFTSTTDLEVGLRGTIENFLNLNWAPILGTESQKGLIDVPTTSRLVSTNLLNGLSLEVKDLVNGLLKDVFCSTANGDNEATGYNLIPDAVTDIDKLLTQANIKTIAQGLVGRLDDSYNNGLLVTVLPILNFFLGWTTDAQKYATPSIYFDHGANYIYTSGTSATATLNIINNSSGMLLKHRANIKSDGTFSSVEDKPYTLRVTSIACSVDGTTYDKTISASSPLDIAPYGTGKIVATVPYTSDVVAKFTVQYEFLGKDGASIGGSNKVISYVLISNTTFTNVEGRQSGDDDSGYGSIDQFYIYQFTQGIYDSVTSMSGTINYKAASVDLDKPNYLKFTSSVTDTAVSSTVIGNNVSAATFFSHITATSYTAEIAAAGWSEKFGGTDNNESGSTTGKLYKANANVDKDGITTNGTLKEYPYGLYDMGQIAIKYGSYKTSTDCSGNVTESKKGDGDSKVWLYDFYYYTRFGAEGVMNDYVGKQLMASDFATDAQDEFTAYETALKNVVYYAQFPVTLDFVASKQSKIEAAIETLENAYIALMEAQEQAGASAEASDIAELEAELAKDDGDGETEINFQDYDLFEYFEYQDYRTALRNLVKGMYAPEVLDQYYIEGSGIKQDELTNVIAAAAVDGYNTDTLKAAITASRNERTAEELAASQKAHDDFIAPEYEELYLDDQTARLAYYRQFILPIAGNIDFIQKEIAYGEYNFTDSTLYTEASWARYSDALTAAKAMTTSDLPSEIFAAKYELMVAMKNLLLKTESFNLNNEWKVTLENNKLTADAILAMDMADIELSDKAIELGMTKEEALGHLIRAVGYYYTGEDGNTWNLYPDSALEYLDNDRPNKSTNENKVKATNGNLEAAIAYFVTEVAAPEFVAIEGTTGAFGEVTTDETTGITTGYIFGVAAGDAAENYFALVDETTGTVEWSLGTASVTNGTGAIATVKDTAGNTVAVFTLVVFGDVNGDAAVTAADANLVSNVTVGGEIDGDAYNFAADANGDSSITVADANIVSNVTVGGDITVNPYAA